MSSPTISRKVAFKLDARLAAGGRSLAQHFENRALFFRTVLRAVFYLKVELDRWRNHDDEVGAVSRINESPSSSVRIGVLSLAHALPLSSETSRGRAARPGVVAAACATTRWLGKPNRTAICCAILKRLIRSWPLR